MAEVKSLTEDNEVRQLRLGLGQVLNYAYLLDWPEAKTVQLVLAVERPPAAEYWTALCKDNGVILTWPKKFGGSSTKFRCSIHSSGPWLSGRLGGGSTPPSTMALCTIW